MLIWIEIDQDRVKQEFVALRLLWVVLKRTFGLCVGRSVGQRVYLELVYLVTALVPSDTACLASSPGSSRRTAVWISLEVMVERLL